MKRILTMMIVLLMVAGLTACAQNVSAPVGNSSSSDDSSSSVALPGIAAGEPSPEKGSSTPDQSEIPSTAPSESTPTPEIKADTTSVILDMPSEVKFGETATATIINNSTSELVYGVDYTFQYYVNGGWANLKYREGKERVWIEIACSTQPGEKGTLDFDINSDEFTIPLKAGDYRLVKNIGVRNGDELSPLGIAGTFTIK
ncbi:MAG TPA: immunoglobulin-like domain-containing protein [Clostridia bacterium]|nr:immunoglobulin-like domain-containing protein [Clostridia bacterium]